MTDIPKEAEQTCRCGKGCAYDNTVVFFREGMFYPITGAQCEDWSVHAELNPGTLKIETLTGERIWPEGVIQ